MNESKLLDLANQILQDLDPPLIEGTQREITDPQIVAALLAVEQILVRFTAVMEDRFAQVDRALISIGKIGTRVN